MSLSPEQREDMLLQTQSASYQEWMTEDDWEECLDEKFDLCAAYYLRRVKRLPAR
jgi:hypothetical protein